MFAVVSPFTVKWFDSIGEAVAECRKLTELTGEAIGLFLGLYLIVLFRPKR